MLALVGFTVLVHLHSMHLCHVHRHVSQYPIMFPLYVTTSAHTNACSDTILHALVVEAMLLHAIFSIIVDLLCRHPFNYVNMPMPFLISLHNLNVHAPNRACIGNLIQALLVL